MTVDVYLLAYLDDMLIGEELSHVVTAKQQIADSLVYIRAFV